MFHPSGYRGLLRERTLAFGGKRIMPFEVKGCTIDEMHRHPTFRDRTQAKVKVVLREIRAREAFDHNLTLRVWADTNDQMSSNDVKMALLTRAATILKRTMSAAEVEVGEDGLVSRPKLTGYD